jgi:quinol monooxygenase YgiN
MIVVRIMLKVKPELQTQFTTAMRDNIQEARKFEGCQNFDIFSHKQEVNSYLLYQDSDYFKQSGGELFPLLDGNPDAAYYQSSRI